MSLQSFLESAGVSRTAYYSLIRRNSVLPRSVQAMAGMLGVASSAILEEESPVPGRARALIREAGEFMIVGLAAAALQGAPAVTQVIDL